MNRATAIATMVSAGLLALAGGAVAQAAADPQAAAAHGPTWGEHGMVLFGGRDGLFASHLPMFHAPHDWHVVLSLRIEDPAIDAAMRARLASKPALWTLVPEHFELARLAPGSPDPLRGFKADLVEGHFERGGRTMYRGVVVRVQRVASFERLDAQAGPSPRAHYEPVGQGATWFLVKTVHARPDFDHIAMLDAASSPGAVDIPANGIAKPADAAIAAKLPAKARLVGTVYYDTEDLR